ncbi:MAG: cyclodeaminase/cyclohydrolase family protein [Pseudobutyrivibrio sp.]|nr:cyclodeaminase/cyclohydrolase family protein [Pseudobutyrivibrio sp.]
MLEKSLSQFTDVLSTKEPVPGGGGASAYVGAIGVALGNMVGSLTVGKKKYADVEAEIIELNQRSAELRLKLERLVERDAEVFYPLSLAYGMPKDTPQEAAEKERVLQAALVDAALVPLEIVRVSVEALELIEIYAKKGSVIAVSDAGCAAAFCKAAMEGAKLNVLINTKLMKDEELRAKTEAELDELVLQGSAKADEIYSFVESKLR